jgi:hypothetical protein
MSYFEAQTATRSGSRLIVALLAMTPGAGDAIQFNIERCHYTDRPRHKCYSQLEMSCVAHSTSSRLLPSLPQALLPHIWITNISRRAPCVPLKVLSPMVCCRTATCQRQPGLGCAVRYRYQYHCFFYFPFSRYKSKIVE